MASYSVAEQGFIDACKASDLENVKYLLAAWSKSSICEAVVKQGLAISSDAGCLEIVKCLIEERQVDIHENEDVALCLATGKGHLDVVIYLVEKCQAKINAVSAVALYCAADKGHVNTVKYLIEQGVDYKYYQKKNKNAYHICHEIAQSIEAKENFKENIQTISNVEKLRLHGSERSVRRRPAFVRKV